MLNGDNSAYDGTTIVFEGKLIVGDDPHKNASLGGGVIVAPDGTLGGYGTIGGDATFRGGTLSPGNSVGRLTINGNLTLEPGSILETEIAHNGSDVVNVKGSAAISDSSISITAIDPKSSYQSQQTYTIMHADGGISGTFGTVVSKSAFLDLSITYWANDVRLQIAVKQDPTGPEPSNPGTSEPETPGPGTPEPEQPSPALFTTVAQTRNQYATAGGLDSLAQTGSSLALYNSLLMLS
ncbi:autotransporter outer membrane beta-barrel domain-containing protein, partial [Ochrobactrum sp. Q0168]|uniref:autotransporter outer membrane beta-barrel domain-containing protein n=1 Tax=Ochrobactrum sp. Q0168 TaxID=2793241 RepID=UPI0018EC12C7|nr:autotransporter outer membrane beta-barrel domain-containing protein [Ochrobactrum sp. Q0168]